MLPPLPCDPSRTILRTLLLATLISPVAFNIISPTTLSDVPESFLVPPLKVLSPKISRFLALTTILPPPSLATNTAASFVRDTEARVTLRGNFKLRLSPSTPSATVPGSANPPNSTLPP